MIRVIAAIALVALAIPAIGVAASCPKTSLADVEDEVMCPVCGVPLGLATEAPQAQREREFIQREVESCKSKQQIKDALVAQFGDRVLALPPADKGFNFAAYAVPAAVILIGIAAVTTVALRRRRSASADDAMTSSVDADDAQRLDADMKRYDY